MTRFLKGTDRPLAEAYQLALLDLDGVVYRGKNPVEYAADSIRAAEAAGMTIEYTTNNSSRFQHVVADQLKGFGLDVEPWQVITSSVVAARMVAKALPAGARVQVLGAEHLRDEVTRNGLTIVDGPQDRPQAVIQGWYPDMTWQMMADAAFAVEAGATYFVTNRDLTIPRELGIAPGCGSMIRAVITATGVEPAGRRGQPGDPTVEARRRPVGRRALRLHDRRPGDPCGRHRHDPQERQPYRSGEPADVHRARDRRTVGDARRGRETHLQAPRRIRGRGRAGGTGSDT